MPQFSALPYGAQIVFEALDPATGAAVTGVAISNVSIWADVSDATTTQPALFSIVGLRQVA